MAWSYREHRRNEQLRVGRLGIVDHPVGEAALDHFAALHHQDPVGQQPGDGEIVHHEHDREPHLGNQATDEIEEPSLEPKRRDRRSARP